MGFSFGNMFKKAPVETGPRIVGRSDWGNEFVLGPNEAFVLNELVVSHGGAGEGRLSLNMKSGDRNGRLDIPFNQSSSAHPWFEYSVAPLALDPTQRAKLKVNKLAHNTKPVIYDADFWLKQGEAAAFEHGLIVRNKQTSKSRMGEFTNVILELEHKGQKRDVTLVSFAKGKEKFVFSQSRKSASFGNFEVSLNSATDNEAVLKVTKASGLIAL
jgi:hypothetical protein